MRLAFFGLTITSSWGNGHATTNRALVRALAARGHAVTFYERDQPFYARHRDFRRCAGVEVVLYREWERERIRALRHASACDAVITTSYAADGAAIAADLFALPRPRQVFYDLDTPVTLEGLEANAAATLQYLRPEHIPRFDLYLSYAAGPALAEITGKWRARQAAALFLCVDPRVHRPGAAGAPPAYQSALSYLGTYAPDREATLEQLLLAPAAALPREQFTLAGSMYPRDRAWPSNLRRWHHLSPGRHGAFFGASRFTLNLTRAAVRRRGFAPQGRIFDAACCGTPVITDPWPGLEGFYTPGREILVARDSDDVCRALRDLSSHHRNQIAWRARHRTLREHSAPRRARELELLLG